MEFLEFFWWSLKRILSIVVVTWGQLEMIAVFMKSTKKDERIHEILRYSLFIVFTFITSGVYDFAYISENGKIIWEVYALSMACIVCYQPIKKAISPTIERLLAKIAK